MSRPIPLPRCRRCGRDMRRVRDATNFVGRRRTQWRCSGGVEDSHANQFAWTRTSRCRFLVTETQLSSWKGRMVPRAVDVQGFDTLEGAQQAAKAMTRFIMTCHGGKMPAHIMVRIRDTLHGEHVPNGT